VRLAGRVDDGQLALPYDSGKNLRQQHPRFLQGPFHPCGLGGRCHDIASNVNPKADFNAKACNEGLGYENGQLRAICSRAQWVLMLV
jgi:hypothetical protein